MSDAHSPIRRKADVDAVVKATGCTENEATIALHTEGWVVVEAIAAVKLHQKRTAEIAPWHRWVKRAVIALIPVAAIVLYLVWVTR